MDRPGRFSHYDSKFYEASHRSSTPGGDRSRTPASPGEEIRLDELYEWTRRREWPARQDAEDLRQWRRRATATADDVKDWPGVVVLEKETDGGLGRPGPLPSSPPAAGGRYDRNFLHPPTPSPHGFPHAASPAGDDGAPVPAPVPGALPRRPTSLSMNIERTSRFGWWTLVLLAITAVMTTLTALYANGSAKSLMQDKFFTTSSSNAILILRILTEACALLFAALVMVVVEDLQWALASRPAGVSLLHFVGLDAGTGVWGLLRLLATADWRHKPSSLFRLLVICAIPLPGIVLMGDITLDLVFFPRSTYDVSAGVGRFNASYIDAVDETIVTAMLIQMGSMTWSTKDTWAADPLGPRHGGCTVSEADPSWAACEEAHLLVGGVLGISPQRDDLTTFPDATAYVVPGTRSLHLEYGTVHDVEALYRNGTCYTIGADTAAAYWCADTGKDKELLFGSSYCPLAVQSRAACLNDTSWTAPLQIASSLFVFKRYTTVNYDRGNMSILSVTDLSPPEREVVALGDYMTALSAVVPGFRPQTAAGPTGAAPGAAPTRGDNSALAMYAVTALPLNDNQVAKSMSLAAVRKAMAVPFNYFHANYFSPQSIWEGTTPRAGLSADMYTRLSLAVKSYQVSAGGVSRWLFGLLSGVLLALSAATVVATARVCERVPQRCGYPTLDFAAVCAVKGGIPRPVSPGGPPSPGLEGGGRRMSRGSSGLHRSLTSLGQKPGPFQVASRIKDERIVLGP